MKQKLFTLLTLLCFAVSGAWADTEVTLTAASGNSTSAYYFAADGTAITAIAGSGAKSLAYDSGAKITVDGKNNPTATIAFTIASGITITSFKVNGTANGNTTYALDGGAVTFGTALTSLSKTGSMDFVLTCTDAASSSSNRNTKITSIVIEYTVSGSSAPTLTGASSSPAANATGIAVSSSGYLQFSKVLTSVTSANITISPNSNGEALNSIALDGTDKSKVNYSWSGLKKETQYTINIAADAVSDGTNGNAATSLKFTTVEKTASSFALTSAAEVEVAIAGTSNITTTGNAGTVTYESDKTSVATVTSAGVITAVAGGKATITVTDPGSDDVKSSTKTVTVLVPYANPAAADSYVLNWTQYGFSNTANTKYYFKNGFTITPNSAAALQYASIESNTGLKLNHTNTYTIKVPANVTVKWAEIEARTNATKDNQSNWGTVFGTDYSGITLPWSNEDPAYKDFIIASPSAGAELTIAPGGYQWQAIITLHTDTYHAKNSVSYDKGSGTGTMTGTEKREGDTFTLPASTFTNPASKYFKGWLCSVDSKRYAAGDTYTMTDAATTFTAQYGAVEGTMIIKAKATGRNTYVASGSIGGTVAGSGMGSDVIDGGYKFNRPSYISLTLPGGNSFKTGDILNVHITSVATSVGSTIAVYETANKDKDHVLYNTGELGVVGNNMFVLPDAVDGLTTFCVCRPNDKSNEWNAYVDYIEVYRPHIVTLNGSGFATYSKDWDFKVQSGATMYKMALDITDPANPTITGTEVTGAPAGAGVLLKGTAGDKAYILNSSQISALASNSLNGTTDANGDLVEIDKSTYDYYVLSGDTFKKYTGDAFGANKAFFQTANGALASARAFTITFDDGETTSITGVEAKKFVEDNKFYNLNGQQVAQPTKGLYIVNGRKVVIK